MNTKKRLNIIIQHIKNNSREYIIVTLIFVIGIFLGVMFINNSKDAQIMEITSYLDNFIQKFKSIGNLDYITLLRTAILQNIVLAITLWFFGTTVIGIPIVFGIILYRGFCLGYTISTVISIMGIGKGIIFIFISLFLQNIIFIPSIIAIGVSRI